MLFTVQIDPRPWAAGAIILAPVGSGSFSLLGSQCPGIDGPKHAYAPRAAPWSAGERTAEGCCGSSFNRRWHVIVLKSGGTSNTGSRGASARLLLPSARTRASDPGRT